MNRRVQFESLESRTMLATVPYGAMPNDTAEFMLGDVRVTVVLLESNGALNPSTENWTPQTINQVKANVNFGLQWWEETLQRYYPSAYLNFDVDFTFADQPFSTKYEPINNTSNNHVNFVQEFLEAQGSWINGDLDASIFAFNNDRRLASGNNWAYTLFVVNDQNDLDHKFAATGTFSQSFAYGGGRYLVTLASRPPEIYAHETGHIFWAADEYTGSNDLYTDSRGYYATQITNSASGAPVGFSQEDSLMSSGYRLTSSYNNHTLPLSTQAHLGWRDADSNGIIDLLDVPFTLTGSGFRDSQGNYRFVGQSTVQASPNRNPYGLKNDITINRIRVAEYKLDDGPWTVAATYDTYSAALNLTIPLPAGEHSIQIRTRDTTTSITSTIFSASTNLPASAALPGLSGFAFNDVNNNGVWEASEGTIGGRDVQLVSASGIPLPGPTVVEADAYASNENVTLGVSQFAVSATGSNVASTYVYAVDATLGHNTSRVLGNRRKASLSSVMTNEWTNSRQLRVDFDTPVAMLSIDAIGVGDSGSYGRLEIYDANDKLLDRYTTRNLTAGQIEKMLLRRGTADIAYALAFGHAGKSVALDNVRVGPEVSTTTDARGAYSLPSLASGTYYVKASVPLNWIASNPSLSVRQTNLVAGQLTAGVNFGQHSLVPSWQNASNRFDVDSNSAITPLDALLIINNLNTFGARQLTSPPPSGATLPNFIDVNGDGSLTPIDALEIINYLNAGGMGETAPNVSGTADSGGVATNPPQGEAAPTPPIWWQLPPTNSSATMHSEPESDDAADELTELHALYGPEFWPTSGESSDRRRGAWVTQLSGEATWLDILATDVAARARS